MCMSLYPKVLSLVPCQHQIKGINKGSGSRQRKQDNMRCGPSSVVQIVHLSVGDRLGVVDVLNDR